MTSLEQRFWAKVRKDSDCWVWTGAFSSTGYGGFKVNGRDEGAHRFPGLSRLSDEETKLVMRRGQQDLSRFLRNLAGGPARFAGLCQ
jgi:hypothetical protein